ncbi:SdpI family protein [Ascidiimonas aurantiaca]|uniref:SdpI family protein n=1 Tax=Ascidiimonas aurantiaca TaxID=1685432 RepID=UPI0030EDC1CC
MLGAILVFDTLILLFPLLLYYFPPKEINALYGYRTKRSSKNETNWRFAQRHFARNWIKIPFIVFLTQLVLILSGVSIDVNSSVLPLVSLSEFVLGSFVCAYTTENALKRLEKENNTPV